MCIYQYISPLSLAVNARGIEEIDFFFFENARWRGAWMMYWYVYVYVYVYMYVYVYVYAHVYV